MNYAEHARRMDAALAEAGHGVGTVWPTEGGVGFDDRVPRMAVWKADQLAGPWFGTWTCAACCLAHYSDPPPPKPTRRCESVAPFTEDCGVDR